ncbi:uncharacterized protein PHALS_13009 [Plasmopara halstedii]|uniref:Histone chaperone domain-containing protein n=1 Tax=Plasmopara halstedii TaxID=4781 RepID=A0A0P1ANP3_PLAHL|nr:uncharacterized protein PHALS_13009 [Plasmopara halstedii]CEG42759.1 hypothetical protein PHALS_13009 [Plasmopara halstedii]|eukprot:XP_024579128.1 hypothetical protein PHALS_13009 [Plasmopara halstedii]
MGVEKTAANVEKDTAGQKRKNSDLNENSTKGNANSKREDDKDGEDSEDHVGGTEDDDDEGDDDEDDSDEEDMAPKSKKRRANESESDNSGNESESELKMTEDDLVGVDTSNIIPRSQRRAAKAAMALSSDEIATEMGHTPAPLNGENEDNSDSEEAVF